MVKLGLSTRQDGRTAPDKMVVQHQTRWSYSTRQDGRTVQIVRLPGPDAIKSKENKNFSFRVRSFVFLWVLNSWTDISTVTPDPGPERITETHLDRISLVSHPGVHHGRDMPGSFLKKKK